MSTRSAILFFALGTAASSAVWRMMTSHEQALPRSNSMDDSAIQDNAGLSTRLRELIQSMEGLRARRVPDGDEPAAMPVRSADVSKELGRLEEALDRLSQQLESISASEPGEGPSPKAKDEATIAATSARGLEDRKINTSDYWGWSPRDVYSKFGKPDASQWDASRGQLDWFYYGPETRGPNRYHIDGGALQFRFEAGMVSNVFP